MVGMKKPPNSPEDGWGCEQCLTNPTSWKEAQGINYLGLSNPARGRCLWSSGPRPVCLKSKLESKTHFTHINLIYT